MARDYPTGPVKSQASSSPAPHRDCMPASPLHLLHFEGGSALSAFRAQALLARLQAACPRITGVAARHVHWVGVRRRAGARRRRQAAGAAELRRCRTPADGRRRTDRRDAAPGHRLALGQQGHRHRAQLRPRRCTASSASPNSAWRSKSGLFGAGKPLSAAERAGRGGAAARPHDRERGLRARRRGAPVRRPAGARRWRMSTCSGAGRAALVAANAEFGLALSDDEIDYLRRRLHAACSATPATSS